MEVEDQPIKRKRGRPPKESSSQMMPTETAEKRKRGRPRKELSVSPDPPSQKGDPKIVVNGDDDSSDDDSHDDIDIHDRASDMGRIKYQGRNNAHGGGPSHDNGLPGILKLDRPTERTAPPRNRRFFEVTPQSPSSGGLSLMPVSLPSTHAHADPIMEEAVKRSPSMDAVVKVFCVHTEPNFSLPWQMKRQFSSNSSGFIISGRRVLTNAHSVEHHTQVKVKRRGSDTKFLATVLAIGTECDIGIFSKTPLYFFICILFI